MELNNFLLLLKERSESLTTICDLYDTLTIAQAIIFCIIKRTVDNLIVLIRILAKHDELTLNLKGIKQFLLPLKERSGSLTPYVIYVALLPSLKLSYFSLPKERLAS